MQLLSFLFCCFAIAFAASHTLALLARNEEEKGKGEKKRKEGGGGGGGKGKGVLHESALSGVRFLLITPLQLGLLLEIYFFPLARGTRELARVVCNKYAAANSTAKCLHYLCV